MSFRQKLSGFWWDETGTFTAEALFWLAVTAGAISLAVDASNSFYRYSNVLRAAQDGNRQYSYGRYRDTDLVEQFVEQALSDYYEGVNATTWVDGNIVVTRVTIPWGSLHMFGFLRNFDTPEAEFLTAHRVEWM